MDGNPIFQDGDMFYDGVLHREVPEIDAWARRPAYGSITPPGLVGRRAAGVPAGAGSVGVAWGQEPTPRSDYIKDYGFRPGVAIEELLGVQEDQLQRRPERHGHGSHRRRGGLVAPLLPFVARASPDPPLIPAKAGTQVFCVCLSPPIPAEERQAGHHWVPAFRGMSGFWFGSLTRTLEPPSTPRSAAEP